MFGRRCNFLVPMVIVAALALFSSRAFAQSFIPACTDASLPGKAVDIDKRCGIQGAGGKEAEQNQVKNNFCAHGSASVITFDQLKTLQGKVEQDKSINFGSKGPTTDRAPLKALGEGDLVQLKAYVLKANQEQAESVNCGHEFDQEQAKNLFHDIHISLVETKDLASPASKDLEPANECQGIVAEMIPHSRPPEWTQANVKRVADKHLPVRVTGQRFFDSSHVPCAEGKPVGSNPKRISLWEIHPIYKFEVCTAADCDTAPTWVTLEDWVNRKSGAGATGSPNP